MFLNPQHRKALQIFWGIFAGLIILSMVMVSFAALYQ
jgi:hypothetical protein